VPLFSCPRPSDCSGVGQLRLYKGSFGFYSGMWSTERALRKIFKSRTSKSDFHSVYIVWRPWDNTFAHFEQKKIYKGQGLASIRIPRNRERFFLDTVGESWLATVNRKESIPYLPPFIYITLWLCAKNSIKGMAVVCNVYTFPAFAQSNQWHSRQLSHSHSHHAHTHLLTSHSFTLLQYFNQPATYIQLSKVRALIWKFEAV
jgi:hypothetical protein